MENLNSKHLKKFQEKKNIRKEEKKYHLKNILSKEDFNKEVLKFKEKVKNYENEKENHLKKLMILNLKVQKLVEKLIKF